MILTVLNVLYTTVLYTYEAASLIFYVFHTVMPLPIELGIVGTAAYFATSLRKGDLSDAISIFGPEPGSKDANENPDKVVHCIAHRGASLDAPENTMAAFKYCVDHDCKFVELDVMTCKDGKLVVVHDNTLERLASGNIATDVKTTDWDTLKNIDVGANHPNKEQFKQVHLCLLEEALDYLLENKCRMIIDLKGNDPQLTNGILNVFKTRPKLYSSAAVTCFNPLMLYMLRRKDPRIVGAMSYQPFCFSHKEFDQDNGPNVPRFQSQPAMHYGALALDGVMSLAWRICARWCGVSAIFLHKSMARPIELWYWRHYGVRCVSWSVNSPLEKLYWRNVLRAPYLSSTLVGEGSKTSDALPEIELVDDILKKEKEFSTKKAATMYE